MQLPSDVIMQLARENGGNMHSLSVLGFVPADCAGKE